MNLICHLLSVYYFGLLTSLSSCYVILAYNLDKISRTPEEILPRSFANDRIKNVSPQGVDLTERKANEETGDANDEYYYYSDDKSDSQENYKKEAEDSAHNQDSQGFENDYEITHQRQRDSTINIDDIVEKVKERLLQDFEKKGMFTKSSSYYLRKEDVGNSHRDSVKIGSSSPWNHKTMSKYQEKGEKNHPETNSRNEDMQRKVNTDFEKKIGAQSSRYPSEFKKIQNKPDGVTNEPYLIRQVLGKEKVKDSYEDYVTPDKDNKFESNENKAAAKFNHSRLRKKNNDHDVGKIFKKSDQSVDARQHDSTEKSLKLNGESQTQSMKWDYDENRNLKTFKNNKISVTNKPTSKRFSIRTPNYYNTPIIAEKYNFNEPIPENDREPEKPLKQGYPEDLINGKKYKQKMGRNYK